MRFAPRGARRREGRRRSVTLGATVIAPTLDVLIRPVRAPDPHRSARAGRAEPAREHLADLVALAGEVEVLRLRDAAEGAREAHEHPGADEATRGGGEVGALVAAVGGLDEGSQ